MPPDAWKTVVVFVTMIASFGSVLVFECMIGLLIVPLVALVVSAFISGLRKGPERRRYLRERPSIAAQVARGELSTAHDALWAVAEEARARDVSAHARHQLGWVLTRQGKFDEAIDVLTDNARTHQFQLKELRMQAATAAYLALNHGLRGDVPSAEQWMAEAMSLARGESSPSILFLVRSVIECRSSRAAETVESLDSQWAELDAAMTGEHIRPLRIVRAFALATSDPRSIGKAERMLTNMRPSYQGEYDLLRASWPEMDAFIQVNGLGNPAQRSG